MTVLARHLVSSVLSAGDTYTDWMVLGGKFNISVSGTFVGTVTLQRKFGTSGTALDRKTYTASAEDQLEEIEDDVWYRIGFKTAEYTSGSITARLSQ